MNALEKMRALLEQNGCTAQLKASREQWIYPHSRRAIVIVNIEKLTLRLCAERICDYADAVPQALKHVLVSAPACGGGCKPWGGRVCAGGWHFFMDGREYNKCRYNAFIFGMTRESLDDVCEMLKMELNARKTV